MTDTHTNALSTRYNPKDVEARIYRMWNDAGVFKPNRNAPNGPFVIVIPPPNVTGVLHMGHALNNTLQDILIRYKRMTGHETLWVPGIDHAGIATQSRVEREIWQTEKKTRHDIGRDALLKRIWEWKNTHGDRILEQLKRLGCSCDWDYTAFTMDDSFSRGVTKVFVEMYRKGLVYKGKRLANLSPKLETVISNDEVEYRTVTGSFWHIRYPVENEPGRYVVIATTRPETMLGDTAVAVHPDDDRYRDLIGKYVILPIIGRRLKVIADEYVDREKGTGCLKVTPAHDPNDYDIGKRHGLEFINILNVNGTLNEHAGEYAGMDRLAARPMIVERLEQDGLLDAVHDYEHEVGHCSRSGDVIEPFLCDQWYVKMKPFVELARKAEADGRVKFTPARYGNTYRHWLDSTPDWAISRQLWWGHRIPIWTRPAPDGGEETYCGETAPDGEGWTQDPDVLDTWFSSQLWAMGVFGWPNETDALKRYYPTSVLVTARDIIALWVARMVMMGEYFMHKAPFADVYINGTLLDHLGRRMSKSLGNGIDPIVMIDGGQQDYCGKSFKTDGFGADGVRFVLTTMTTEGQDLKIHPNRFEDGRNFVNKIWNAGRFVLTNLDGKPIADSVDPAALPFEFKWILSRLNRTLEVVSALDRFRFNDVALAIRDFAWNEFCAWAVEGMKFHLRNDASDEYGPEDGDAFERATIARRVLAYVMDTTLRMLHPLCPFVTEELFQRLKAIVPNRTLNGEPMTDWSGKEETLLAVAKMPDANASLIDPDIEQDMAFVHHVITGIRTIRSALALPPKQMLPAHISAGTESTRHLLESQRKMIVDFANCEIRELGVAITKPAPAAAKVYDGVSVFVPLEGLIDPEVEIRRQKKELAKIEGGITGIEKKLANPKFIERAPADVVESETERLAQLRAKARDIAGHLKTLSAD